MRMPALFAFCFNGAALFQVRKGLPNGWLRRSQKELQWGRTLSSAESWAISTAEQTAGQSFNGAALFQVRKEILLSPIMAIRASFNGAALFQVRKDETGLELERRAYGFNGAALFQVRKACKSGKGELPCLRFNGAALFQVRKGALRNAGDRDAFSCFNGAALFQVRKDKQNSELGVVLYGLQWGRTLSSAESSSMKPAWNGARWLQWGRTLSSAERHAPPLFFRNYGQLQWGRTLSSAESAAARPVGGRQRWASMGPHSFKCGKVNETRLGTAWNSCFNGAALFQVRKGALH